ncbi:hypothetical protein H206_05373 [Candidatus Electrothrix aarhusensis]|uniref:Uncharacterized protein n=1 Tax=Candidatus Electrothrix aarhusensis TaxID=1859131 RepID=A0A444J4X9_9BACT|nr:hypothetical protein H206_05373 [Candidatus Electrothrix aarhusensis]
MKIRIGQFHITQGRHLEHEMVFFLTGHILATFRRAVCLVLLNHAHLIKAASAHAHTVMAGDAARVLKQLVTGLLISG